MPGNRVIRLLVVLPEPFVELAPLSVGNRELGAGLRILHDAVPQLLHEREPRLYVQREELVETRRRHHPNATIAACCVEEVCSGHPPRLRRCEGVRVSNRVRRKADRRDAWWRANHLEAVALFATELVDAIERLAV